MQRDYDICEKEQLCFGYLPILARSAIHRIQQGSGNPADFRTKRDQIRYGIYLHCFYDSRLGYFKKILTDYCDYWASKDPSVDQSDTAAPGLITYAMYKNAETPNIKD